MYGAQIPETCHSCVPSDQQLLGTWNTARKFQRIWKISFHVFSYFGNSRTSSMVSM